MANFLHNTRKIIALLLFIFSTSQTYAKELSILVYDMADGISLNAQIISKYIPKYMPDITSVRFKEISGSNGIALTNYLYNVSRKDGLEIATIPWNIFPTKILNPNNQNLNFKLEDFDWIGSNMDGRLQPIILWHNKLSNEEIAGSENTVNFTKISFINNALHKNIKEIKGYQNSSLLRAAFERGEVSLMVNSLAGIKTIAPQWLSDPNIEPIIQYGNGKNRSVDYPNIPTLLELSKSQEDNEFINFYELQSVILRPFMAPPNTEKDKLDELRDAFIKICHDPDYIAEAKKRGIDVSLMDWKDVNNIVKQMLSVSDKTLNRFKSM